MDVNQVILNNGYMVGGQTLNPLEMRPYINKQGQSVVSVFAGFKMVTNSEGKSVSQPVYKQRVVYKNAILRPGDWEQVDAEIKDIFRQPTVGYDDLRSSGLVKSLDGLGVAVSTYGQTGDMTGASINMSIVPRKGENDRLDYTTVSVPIPIISKPFFIDLRTLDASRRGTGENLDTAQVRVAGIKVKEAIEDMIFNGSTVQLGANVIYGYTNAPYRVADTATNFGGGDFGTDGNAHKTITGMIAALVAKGFNGPFGVYISSTQYAQTLNLTGANLSDTQLSVIQRTIPDIKFVKRAPKLADGSVLVVQLTKDVVDLAIGQDVVPVSWQDYGGLVNEFIVLAAMAPRIKYDVDHNTGVAHATGA
jgi:uncharacterized linocin/CFP29 family protein